MKVRRHFRSGVGGLVALICALGFGRSTIAAQLDDATVPQVVKQVDLLPNRAAAREAVLNDNVRDGTGVLTGVDSRLGVPGGP
jgi:hypothetical protein